MSGESGSGCKIDRVAEAWGVSDLDARLRERWAEGESLRDLETYVNERLLRAAMRAAGVDPVDGEAANLYRVLTDEGVSPGERISAESRLERAGVEPGAITDAFVSYGTVRNHLRDCLGVETDRDTSPDPDEARRTVLKLVSRTEAVAERAIERLAAAGALTIPEPSVTLSLRVACGDCGDEYTFSELLAREGCSCNPD